MGAILDARRTQSDERLQELRKGLREAQKIAKGKACVYATGSFARGEASSHSDLDLFIVGKTARVKDKPPQRQLKRLDELCITADLIRQTRRLAIPEFSGDGEYLQHYTVANLIASLGTPADDASNTFTARLLLLLESRPLIGNDVYNEAVKQTINAYWRDFRDHQDDFIPAFLSNDILRLWRTFCVNYEARTRAETARERAKRKLKNYKLKHSRLLTCYSALLFLMNTWNRNRTVTPSDAIQMARMTPTQRLESLRLDGRLRKAHTAIDRLLSHYERFLKETDYSETELLGRLLDSQESQKMFRGASEFGKQMSEALVLIGQDSQFLRMLIV